MLVDINLIWVHLFAGLCLLLPCHLCCSQLSRLGQPFPLLHSSQLPRSTEPPFPSECGRQTPRRRPLVDLAWPSPRRRQCHPAQSAAAAPRPPLFHPYRAYTERTEYVQHHSFTTLIRGNTGQIFQKLKRKALVSLIHLFASIASLM